MKHHKYIIHSSRFRTIAGFLTVIILLLIASTGCKKLVEVPPPIDQVISSEVFSNDQTATSAVVGLYSQMLSQPFTFIDGGMTFYPGLSADEIVNNSPNADYDPFKNNAIPPSNYDIQYSLWGDAYKFIYQANDCIAGLNASTGVSAATKQQLTGEMEFSRALCYFYLVNLFGPVPLETTTNYTVNEVMPRTSTDLVYKQIIADLEDAESLLSTSYPASGPTRPNKWTAEALLARVYLYTKDWKDAEATASAIINSGNYSLVKDLNGVFLANSPEAIWQLVPTDPSSNTVEGEYFIPYDPTVIPSFQVTSYLLNAFESGDNRKTDWLASVTISGTTYTYPYKYKVQSGSTKTEYEMVFRLAEQYLIRAEAEAELNNIPAAVADINIIRERAGLPDLPTTLSQADCLKAIAQENRIEFFAEWGHRWFDLNRTGQADVVLGVEKPGWKPTDALYPISSYEIQINHNLTQNPGY